MGRWWLLVQSGCSLTLRFIIHILCSIHTLQNSTFTRRKKNPLTSHMAQIVAVAPDQTPPPHKILVELVVWHHELLACTEYTETLQVHCDPLGTFLLLLKFKLQKFLKISYLLHHWSTNHKTTVVDTYSSRVSNDSKNTTASLWFARSQHDKSNKTNQLCSLMLRSFCPFLQAIGFYILHYKQYDLFPLEVKQWLSS